MTSKHKADNVAQCVNKKYRHDRAIPVSKHKPFDWATFENLNFSIWNLPLNKNWMYQPMPSINSKSRIGMRKWKERNGCLSDNQYNGQDQHTAKSVLKQQRCVMKKIPFVIHVCKREKGFVNK
jgi:hypothetical protein